MPSERHICPGLFITLNKLGSGRPDPKLTTVLLDGRIKLIIKKGRILLLSKIQLFIPW